MPTNTVTQPSTTWPAWLAELYRLADALDAAAFADRFTEDASFTFGNAAPIIGRREIQDAMTGFFATISSMAHQPLRVWETPEEAIFEALVSYGRTDGKLVQVPAVTAYTRKADRVSSCRIYCDMEPVTAPS